MCKNDCRALPPCTGSNSNGIQKRTSFGTEQPGGPNGGGGASTDPSAPPEIPAGDFMTIPTPLKDVAVFGTGQCFECLLGADDHYRCPVHGRRSRLVDRSSTLKGFLDANPNLAPQYLDEAVDLALYAGPDMCFDHKEAGKRAGFKAGPGRMLRDRTSKVSARSEERVGESERDAAKNAARHTHEKRSERFVCD